MTSTLSGQCCSRESPSTPATTVAPPATVRAAYGNHLRVAALLVQAGADVDLDDDTQQSAYLISTSEVGDDPRLLELTLNAGADVEARDSFDGTGLIRAAERGNARIVERLLRAGVDRDHVNRLGYGTARGRRVRGGQSGGPGDGGGAGRRRSRWISRTAAV